MNLETVTTNEALDSLEVTVEPEDPPPPELPALARLGRYELLGRIAIGGMAEIFLARERAVAVGGSRELVVKIMRPELERDPMHRAMFLTEGQVALRLSHPSLCHVYECGTEAGRCFIAMEHVGGVTLREVMRRAALVGRALPSAIVARIGANVADGLHSAHHATGENGRPLGLVHLDVTPQNVMINRDGVVKLLDFGVAQVRKPASFDHTDTVKGKIGYLAPEQLLGLPLDARTDVFALGVCLWESLTGRRLYPRVIDAAAFASVVSDDAPDAREHNPAVPPELSAIVARALARSPDDRYESAAELSQELEQFLADRRERVSAAHVKTLITKLFDGEPAIELDRRPEVVAWVRKDPPRVRWWLAAPVAVTLALGVLVWGLISAPERARVEVRTGLAEIEAEPVEHTPSVTAAVPVVIVAAPDVPEVEAPRRREIAPRPGGFVADPGF
jgi:serine/threonine protein kinase